MADLFAQNFATGAPEQTQLKPSAAAQVAADPELDTPELAVTREFIRDQEAASDEELLQAQQMAEDPEVVNRIVEQARRDAESGEGTFNLTNTEKLVLGAAAIAPLIGGLIGGDEGALAGVGAFGTGLAAFGKAQQQTEKQKAAERLQAGRLSAAKQKLIADKEKENRKNIGDLRKVIREGKIDSLKNFNEMSQKAKELAVALSKGTGVGDTAAVFSFMKILDPGSVVRPGEAEALKEAQGLQGRINAWIEQFGDAQVLTPEAKQQMKDIANETVFFMADQVRKDVGRLRETATLLGVNPDDIVKQDFAESQFFEFEEIVQGIPIVGAAPGRRRGGLIQRGLDIMDKITPSGETTTKPKDTIQLKSGSGVRLKKGSDGKYRFAP